MAITSLAAAAPAYATAARGLRGAAVQTMLEEASIVHGHPRNLRKESLPARILSDVASLCTPQDRYDAYLNIAEGILEETSAIVDSSIGIIENPAKGSITFSQRSL